jgi:Zn-dependent protease
MVPSWNLGRAFGIPLYIHWSFWLLPLWVVVATRALGGVELAMNLAILAALFGCVLLHELGHALTARYYGIGTRSITLYPIGGVARLERLAEKPTQELWITVAGPAVNLAIATLLTAVLLVVGGFDPGLIWGSLAGVFLIRLLFLNLIMVVFNLLPAFPMDGGRMLRSLLAMGLGQLRATRIAVNVGIVMAALLGIGGTLYLGNPWLLAIALFVFVAGQAELQAAYFREQQRREERIVEPLVRPLGEVPVSVFCLQPRITVYTWDNENGRWVKETRDGTSRAL